MRAQGFGESVVPGTDIYEIARRGALAAGMRAPISKTFGFVNQLNFVLRGALVIKRRARKPKASEKQDQSGILAQNIFLCGKLRLGIFPRSFYSALQFRRCQVARK